MKEKTLKKEFTRPAAQRITQDNKKYRTGPSRFIAAIPPPKDKEEDRT